MATKGDLGGWILAALRELGGTGTILQISEIIWRDHERDLRVSGGLFYTWQYDLRWAGQDLRGSGALQPAEPGMPWRLS
ncbi:hypothetical protein CLV46_2524 [Diaminobutyricimonas aerilata]|uniref:Uncharacterized protein n=1 Tax=Diaminobutyricimonas aerilata TaxID=1162967 RepID=A0A2M9CM15_9MICO|nr:hypothetical protein CLV46_2524 [Diaminobutyricimonas aerilata]